MSGWDGTTVWSGEASAWDATEKDACRVLRDSLEATRYGSSRQAVLAAVIGVDGLEYRRPGAKMHVAGGTHLGAVTADCLEGAVANPALEVLSTGQAVVETEDLTDDEEWHPPAPGRLTALGST